ncbi:MAG: RNHCP domain-containing protein [Planctomycetes bacterium]|nr:RNHCP domain-containing protein [Planctomycetota bacterium]
MDSLPQKRFQRVCENFECLDCGAEVRGNGYTNHCPHCLTSRHVDRNPGDRAADCGAVMPAVRARRDGKKGFMVLHRCDHCGHEKWNRVAPEDSIDEISRLLA